MKQPMNMAGLNFPGNTHFFEEMPEKTNISSFEFIPWILSQCQNVFEVRALLKEINLVNSDFSKDLSLSHLHWMIADQKEAIMVESTNDGVKVYNNPIGILTNNPTFDHQLFNLTNYRHVSTRTTENNFSKIYQNCIHQTKFSLRRFRVRKCWAIFSYLKISGTTKGLCDIGNGQFEYTIYSSCCNMDKGIYYYTAYTNSQIMVIDIHKVELDASKWFTYLLIEQEQINYLN